jgi:hypothetical protein
MLALEGHADGASPAHNAAFLPAPPLAPRARRVMRRDSLSNQL